MDRYLYLLLSLLLLLLWCIPFLLRRDLRRTMLKTSLVGAVAGVLAELWYVRDYWRRPTLVGEAGLAVEDAIGGVAVTGLGVSLYELVFRKADATGAKPRRREFLLLFLAGLSSLLIFSNILEYNSCIVSEIAFALCAL